MKVILCYYNTKDCRRQPDIIKNDRSRRFNTVNIWRIRQKLPEDKHTAA